MRHKKAVLCGSLLKVFSKGITHKTRRLLVSNLKINLKRIADTSRLKGTLIGKNRLTRIILWIKPSWKQEQKLKMKTPKTYTKLFFTNCSLKDNSVKTAFYTTVKNLREECKNKGRPKGSCWTLIIFFSKLINFEHFE